MELFFSMVDHRGKLFDRTLYVKPSTYILTKMETWVVRNNFGKIGGAHQNFGITFA
jgi:hypothetical protein